MNNKTDFAYQRVYQYLSKLTNQVPDGPAMKMPSLRLLARRLRVSISTVQSAYSLLEQEGRICSVPKSGYYALPQPSNDIYCEGEGLLERYQASARRSDMFVFGANEPTLLQSLDSALLGIERDLMRHYPCQPDPRFQPFGDAELRTALAAHYTSSAERCWHPDNVFIGPDKTGVLKTVLKALQLRDCTVLVESPCGWSVLRMLQSFGIRVIEWRGAAEDVIDTEALSALLFTHDVKMVILSSHVAPLTGRVMAQDQRVRLAQVLNRRKLWVLEDDSQGALCFDRSCEPLRDLIDPERLLILGAFDKTIGLEAPFGYLLSRHSRPLWHQQMLLRSFRLPPVRQKAIARLYGSGQLDRHLHALRESLKERMGELVRLVDEFLGDAVTVQVPAGGATLWLDCQFHVDMERVFERLLEQRIVIAPGELFSVQGLHSQSFCLSGAADWSQNIESIMLILRNTLVQERLP